MRYLEHYDFKLVRHALKEREVLLKAAPHIIWPLRFILPHHKALRPRWMIRLGLFLYDHIGGRKMLPASNSVNLRTHAAGKSLKSEFTSGFEYSDCWVQDSRLVVLNAMDALDILTPVLNVKNPPWTHSAVLPGGDISDAKFRRIFRSNAKAISLVR